MHANVPASGPAATWLVSLFVTSLALWFGAAVFFSLGVLPVLFTQLETAEAGRIAALLFPVYFRAALVIGVLASAVAIALARGGGRRWTVAAALLVAMTAAQAWTTLVISPEMAEIRGVEAAVERFQHLHHVSVRLNSVVLIGGVLLAGGSGFLLARRRGET